MRTRSALALLVKKAIPKVWAFRAYALHATYLTMALLAFSVIVYAFGGMRGRLMCIILCQVLHIVRLVRSMDRGM